MWYAKKISNIFDDVISKKLVKKQSKSFNFT